MSTTATTVVASFCLLIGAALFAGACWQASLPASQYKASYAPIGSRNDQQMIFWFCASIMIMVVSLDYVLTGGEQAREFLKNLR